MPWTLRARIEEPGDPAPLRRLGPSPTRRSLPACTQGCTPSEPLPTLPGSPNGPSHRPEAGGLHASAMTARRFLSLGVLLMALSSEGCSGGGGSGTAVTGFQVEALSIPNGSLWEINREIVVTFSEPIDFATVSANTIHIRSTDDEPATGVFRLRDPRTVVFQPNCPTRDDFSDAGLRPDGVTYSLRVVGLDRSANTVRSVGGAPLEVTQRRTFRTPASVVPAEIFQDVRSGPPAPILRESGASTASSTHLETGSGIRVYYELDEHQQVVLSDPDFEVPLNLYSEEDSRVAVRIAFNQPVGPFEHEHQLESPAAGVSRRGRDLARHRYASHPRGQLHRDGLLRALGTGRGAPTGELLPRGGPTRLPGPRRRPGATNTGHLRGRAPRARSTSPA